MGAGGIIGIFSHASQLAVRGGCTTGSHYWGLGTRVVRMLSARKKRNVWGGTAAALLDSGTFPPIPPCQVPLIITQQPAKRKGGGGSTLPEPRGRTRTVAVQRLSCSAVETLERIDIEPD